MGIKIGIYLIESYSAHAGGGYSYYNTLIKAIDEYSFDTNLEIVYVTLNPALVNSGLKRPVYCLPSFPAPSFWEKVRNKFGRYPLLNSVLKPVIYNYPQLYRTYLAQQGIKLLYYPLTDLMLIDDFPFIATYWDIGHYSSYSFPEFSSNGEYQRRENWYRNYINKALLIFSESEAGKREIVNYLGINENKISVVPIFAASLPPVSNNDEPFSKYDIVKGQYFLYPAQFWAHKNHYHLVKAFALFLKANPNNKFKLVLTGSDKGNSQYIKQLATELNIGSQVVFAGFVEDTFLSDLYQNATALVMPTFLGPTNMPLLEATRVLCPVICSDFEGHREMLKDSALYINPLSDQSIATAMQQVIQPDVRADIKLKQTELNTSTAFTITNTLAALNKGLVLAHDIRNCWN